MKSINKIIPLVVYPFDVMISFNETDKQFKKTMKRYGIKKKYDPTMFSMDKNKSRIGRAAMFSNNETCIRLNCMPELIDPVIMGLLQHEVFHAVAFIMGDIGTPLHDTTSESYAYLVQYLTTEIYKEL